MMTLREEMKMVRAAARVKKEFLHKKAVAEIAEKGISAVDWETVRNAADVVKGDDNFITAYIDGIGIGTKARNSEEWAFVQMGDMTYMGATLTPKLYNELKAAM